MMRGCCSLNLLPIRVYKRYFDSSRGVATHYYAALSVSIHPHTIVHWCTRLCIIQLVLPVRVLGTIGQSVRLVVPAVYLTTSVFVLFCYLFSFAICRSQSHLR